MPLGRVGLCRASDGVQNRAPLLGATGFVVCGNSKKGDEGYWAKALAAEMLLSQKDLSSRCSPGAGTVEGLGPPPPLHHPSVRAFLPVTESKMNLDFQTCWF